MWNEQWAVYGRQPRNFGWKSSLSIARNPTASQLSYHSSLFSLTCNMSCSLVVVDTTSPGFSQREDVFGN